MSGTRDVNTLCFAALLSSAEETETYQCLSADATPATLQQQGAAAEMNAHVLSLNMRGNMHEPTVVTGVKIHILIW